MKATTLFDDFCEDISKLKIEEDRDGIESISGKIRYNGATFSVHLSENPEVGSKSYAEYPLRGSVSLWDPRTGMVLESEIKKRSGKKDVRATKDVKLMSRQPKAVVDKVRHAIESLYAENNEQLSTCLREIMPPGAITPAFAIRNYCESYIRDMYSTSSDAANARRKNNLIAVSALLPNAPMASIIEQDIILLAKKKNISPQRQSELKNFWSYCIGKKICSGSLPFSNEHKKRRSASPARQNRLVGSPICVSKTVWLKMINTLFASQKTAIGCGIMLMMSGFASKFIYDLKWNQLIITENNVLVQNLRNDLVGPLHDFSRDIFKDAARYISEYYNELCSKFSKETVDNRYVLSSFESGKRIAKRALTDEAKKLLLSAGIEYDAFSRAASNAESASVNILLETYKAFLKTECGLENDPDTFAFLTGQILNSSTYTSYESHTNPYARERFRQIMLPLSRSEKIGKRYTTSRVGDTTFSNYRPDNTLESVRVTGQIVLQPGETLSVYS